MTLWLKATATPIFLHFLTPPSNSQLQPFTNTCPDARTFDAWDGVSVLNISGRRRRKDMTGPSDLSFFEFEGLFFPRSKPERVLEAPGFGENHGSKHLGIRTIAVGSGCEGWRAKGVDGGDIGRGYEQPRREFQALGYEIDGVGERDEGTAWPWLSWLFFPTKRDSCRGVKWRRLHCFIHRKLGIQDFLQNNHTVEPKPDLVKGLREALLRHLTTILGNDDVTSHFMLLHLLSKVHARDNGLAVGKLSLNLTGFKKETVSVFGKQLTLVLKKLLPLTFCIPLTVEYLNTVSLAPKKNYDTNRLETGVLQLAEGSHLIVDETKLEAGTLNSVGVDNCRLLKNLMELQEVEYDFKYYKMDMKTDAQLLVMSEGKSNILPADVIVPFQPSTLSYSEAVTPEVLEAWRWYLATVRQLTHSIEPEMQKVVERDLVAARQADRTLSPQDLSRLVTMGRLMSLSYGESSLSLEHWQMVKELERLRKQRLQ